MFNVQEQLELLFEDHETSKHLSIREKRSSCDVSASKRYGDLPLRNDNVTLTFITDGVQVFSSSNASLWPLHVMVSELPYAIRRKSILLASLWFGSKPDMNIFMKPFVEQMNDLCDVGFEWRDKGRIRQLRVFLSACTCDAVARCAVQSMSLFNGAYGCGCCVAPGEAVEVGRGHARVYPTETMFNARTNTTHEQHVRQAVRQKHTSGCQRSDYSDVADVMTITYGIFGRR